MPKSRDGAGLVAFSPAQGSLDQLALNPGEKLVQHDRFLGLARPGRGGRRQVDLVGQVGQGDLRPSGPLVRRGHHGGQLVEITRPRVGVKRVEGLGGKAGELFSSPR